MDDVFAKGGKVLDDLASMGYVAPELASWVGPVSGPASEVPQDVPPGTSEGVEALEDASKGGQGVGGLPQGVPQRLPITQKPVLIGQGIPGKSTHNPPHDAPPRGLFRGPSATLTPEEVALLASNQVTYQNGRRLHTELARVSHDS